MSVELPSWLPEERAVTEDGGLLATAHTPLHTEPLHSSPHCQPLALQYSPLLAWRQDILEMGGGGGDAGGG